MHFLQQRRQRTVRPSFLATVVAIVIALVVAVIQPHWLDVLFLEASGGLFSVRAALLEETEGMEARLMSKQELLAKNQSLSDENARLRVRAALYDEVVNERDRLYERFAVESTTPGKLAHVIAAPSRSPYDVILVDVGSDDGIGVGDEAWFDTTLMLGTVESTSASVSRVRLFSSPGVETAVTVGTTTEALLSAVGAGGGAFEMDIPKDIVVAPNDALMLPYAGHGTVGFVREVTANDADSFQTVRAILPINLFESREVMIKKQGDNDTRVH